MCKDNELFSNIVALVVDVDEKHRKEICNILNQQGILEENLHCFQTIGEVKEAIESIPKVNVVIIEAKLKDENGYSLCSLIEWNKENKKVPIIVTTYIDGIGPFRQITVRADAFVPKPINPLTLQRHIKRYLRIQELEEKIQQLSKDKSFRLGDCCYDRGSTAISE